jgi:hypothetical protein
MNIHRIIVIQRLKIVHCNGNDGIYITTFLDFTVWISSISHQRSSSHFKINQIVGMVDHLGAVRIGIKGAVFASVPNQIAYPVPHIPVITI